MTTSGTYALSLDIASFVEESFERAGIDPAALTARHARSARVSLNLMFAEWATKGVHEFTIEEMSNISMVVDQAEYDIPVGTLAIIAPIFIRSSVATPVHMISREDYERIPDKTHSGIVVNMFFDRPSLTIKIWPVGEAVTDAIGYWRLRRIQDVLTAAETPDVPYIWFEALASGLAAKLAQKFNPQRYVSLKQEAKEAFDSAQSFDRQRAPTVFEMQRI